MIFEELALKDDLKAQSKLGFMYLYAKGVDVDFNKALSFLEKASNKGDAEAQYHLGLIYFSDLYKKQDYKKAKALFEKATNQNHLYAQTFLGRMYQNGFGTNKIIVKLLNYLKNLL